MLWINNSRRFCFVILPLLLLVAGVVCAKKRDSWERRSFEDADYDPEADTVEYPDADSRNWKPIRVCDDATDDEPAVCSCVSGGNQTLKCADAGLDSANLLVSAKFGAVNIARLERNEISYLFRRKVLPGHEEHLLVLDLSQNQIVDIEPGAFNAFSNLLELKLTHNNLTELSNDIFTSSLRSLHHLYLDYNFLSHLDTGLFDNLVSLTKLVLDGNRKLRISNKVLTKSLAKLEVLSMDRCSLATLDADLFINLPNLRALSLSGNPLRQIPLAILPAKLPGLQVLAMSDTSLEQLNNGELAHAAPKLQKLYMRKMRMLKRIGDCAFCELDMLESLDFSESKSLTAFDANAFGKRAPKTLKQLNLKNCGLSTLSKELMKPEDWQRMDALRLNGNPWKCNCNLHWMLVQQEGGVFQMAVQFGKPTCALPANVRGLSIEQALNNKQKDCSGAAMPSDEEASGTTSMGKFVVLLVFMVLCASVLVFGIVYAQKRYALMWNGCPDVNSNGNSFQMPRFMGGSNGGPFNQIGFGGRTFLVDEDDDDAEEEAEEGMEETAEIGGPEQQHVTKGRNGGGNPQAEFV